MAHPTVAPLRSLAALAFRFQLPDFFLQLHNGHAAADVWLEMVVKVAVGARLYLLCLCIDCQIVGIVNVGINHIVNTWQTWATVSMVMTIKGDLKSAHDTTLVITGDAGAASPFSSLGFNTWLRVSL